MTLLEAFLLVTREWRSTFPQERTWKRATRQALGFLLCLGRRTLTRVIWTNGGQNQPWAAEYHLHSRSTWNPQSLFAPILRQGLAFCSSRLVGVAIDDTCLRKAGRSIKQAFYQRDPMSPPFHVNLILGLRFLQASLLIPSFHSARVATRAVPIQFQEVSRVKKPSRNATQQDWENYRQASKTQNLSQSFVEMVAEVRTALDQAGGKHKTLVVAGDGSFCNRKTFRSTRDRTELILRTRKDAALCYQAPEGSRRFYAIERFTPEQVRQNNEQPWKTTHVFYGGKKRRVRYKELPRIFWPGGARRLPLRLLVVAATPYRKRKPNVMYYRQPAYLFTTDLKSPVKQLLQIYFDRWQIEVNHRDEKTTLGVGEAQLWNPKSVPRQPVLAVAAYSALLLASLMAFGPGRNTAYAPLPKWRRNAYRPSCLDLVTLLREEAVKNPQLTEYLNVNFSHEGLTNAAAA